MLLNFIAWIRLIILVIQVIQALPEVIDLVKRLFFGIENASLLGRGKAVRRATEVLEKALQTHYVAKQQGVPVGVEPLDYVAADLKAYVAELEKA